MRRLLLAGLVAVLAPVVALAAWTPAVPVVPVVPPIPAFPSSGSILASGASTLTGSISQGTGQTRLRLRIVGAGGPAGTAIQRA